MDAGRDPAFLAAESVEGNEAGIFTNELLGGDPPTEVIVLEEKAIALVPKKANPEESVSTKATKKAKKTTR